MMDLVTTSTPLLAPQPSPIYTLDYSTFLTISAKDFQDLFQAYTAIVVSGCPTWLKCDLASLEELGSIDEPRCIVRFTMNHVIAYSIFFRQLKI